MKPDPFHGRGQGATDAPATWGFISDNIIRAYNKRSHRAIIKGPITKAELSDGINIFVDDSNLLVIAIDEQRCTVEDLMRHNLQIWERLLYATGGKLELTKCKFTILRWEFTDDGYPKLWTPPHPASHTISIQSSITQLSEEVEYILPSSSYKLLGVQIALDGNAHHQLQDLTAKISKLTDAFLQCPLQPCDTRQGYETIFMPSTRYMLPATAIPFDALEKAQRQIKDAVLPKLGFNRNMPLAIVYAPALFGGIALKHLGVEQGIEHICILIAHIRSETPLGKACLILVESFQVNAGIFQSPLENTSHIPYVEAPWLDVIRGFLELINGKITIPAIQPLQPKRASDTSIMEEAMKSGLSQSDLIDINLCRLWLQVNNLSEICNGEGTHILQEAFHGTTTDGTPKLYHISVSTLTWPQQPRPSTRIWRRWQKFLKSLCTAPYKLKQALGPWLPEYANNRIWKYLCCEDSLWTYTGVYWRQWQQVSSTRRQRTFRPTANISLTPHRIQLPLIRLPSRTMLSQFRLLL